MSRTKRKLSPLGFCCLLYGGLVSILTAVHFPYHTDPQLAAGKRAAADGSSLKSFYADAYDAEPKAEDAAYVKIAADAAEKAGVKGAVGAFAREYGLRDKRVLEVGAGRGYLQDVVRDYTALDISPTARRFFRKPFVLGSATDLPFADGSFDAVWTIWVLEHVPNPEQAMSEMRRVLKPGGVLYLAPAWLCNPWAADGYPVRPYGDFDLGGKLVKASIPLQIFSSLAYTHPIRALRRASAEIGGPTRFHYNLLRPNYEKYWQADSDALNSLDPYEAMLWFESRGDRCLNCGDSGWEKLNLDAQALVIRRAR